VACDTVFRSRSDSNTMSHDFKYCEKIAKGHYENFPVGWFIPKNIQKYIFALYAFARTADDFADEEHANGRRLEKLQEWDERLHEAVKGRGNHPLFLALSHTFKETALPPKLLSDLLVAFRWDVTKQRYKNFEELEKYCEYSANPIGRAVLILFGYQDPQLLEWSDKICTGIQLVNHWQDVAVDLKKDRIYLPEEDLKKFGVSVDSLKEKKVSDSFRSLMKFEVERARQLFYEGEPLLKRLHRRLRWQIELMWMGPFKVLEKIEALNYDVLNSRPTVSKLDFAKLFLMRRLRFS
jgi:hydroxysqualene synthase